MHRAAAAVSRQALTTAMTCIVLLLMIYLMAVFTEPGQRFEDAVLAGAAAAADVGSRGDWVDGVAHAIAAWSLRSVSMPTLIACVGVVVAIGLFRRRALLGLLSGGVVVASVVTTEVVRWVASRPVLLEHGIRRADQSFPSGHTATAISVMFGLILVMPPRFRTQATTLAAPWAFATSVATITIGWHRPSDTVGSEVISLCYACLAIAIIARRTPHSRTAAIRGLTARRAATSARLHRLTGQDRNVLQILIWAYAVIAAVAVGIMFFDHGLASTTTSASSTAAYLTGRVIVLASGVVVTVVLLRLLSGVDLAERRNPGSIQSGDVVSTVGTTAASGR